MMKQKKNKWVGCPIVMISNGRIQYVETKKKVGCPRAVKSKPPLADRLKLFDKRKTNERPRKNDERKVHHYPPSHSAPSLSSSSLNNASCFSRSLFSHSEASLAAPSPSSATGGPDVLPTSVPIYPFIPSTLPLLLSYKGGSGAGAGDMGVISFLFCFGWGPSIPDFSFRDRAL